MITFEKLDPPRGLICHKAALLSFFKHPGEHAESQPRAGKFPRVSALREVCSVGLRLERRGSRRPRSSAGSRVTRGSRAGSLSRVPAAESAASCRGVREEPLSSQPPARPLARPPRMRSPAQDALTPRTKSAATGQQGVGGRCLPELCGHRTAAPQLRAPGAGGGRGGGGESGHRPAVPPPCRLPAAPASG